MTTATTPQPTVAVPNVGLIVRDQGRHSLPPEVQSDVASMSAVIEDMGRHMVGHRKLLELQGIGLLGGGNIFLHGEPGVNKTGAARLLAERVLIDGQAGRLSEEYFELVRKYEGDLPGRPIPFNGFHRKLYSVMTEAEEIMGSHNFKAMGEAGLMIRHQRGTILDHRTVIHFADEFFDAGSGVQNMMLGLFDKTPTYDENGVTYELDDHLMLVMVASNNKPSMRTGAAIYDRLQIKYPMHKLPEREDKIEIMRRHIRGNMNEANLRPHAAISLSAIKRLRAFARQHVAVPEGIYELLATLDEDLQKKAGINVSPRTMNNALDALQAYALLKGSNQVANRHMGVLTYLVADTEMQRQARDIILDLTAPREKEVDALYRAIGNDVGEWLALANSPDPKKKEQAWKQREDEMEAISKRLGTQGKATKPGQPATMYGIATLAEDEGYDVDTIMDLCRHIEDLQRQVAKRVAELTNELNKPMQQVQRP